MDDVGPDGDVHGDRNAEPRSGREQARVAMGKLSLASVDVVADGFAEPFAFMGPAGDGLVQHAAGFFCHAESAVVDLRVDFLGRVPHERQFEIVNDPGAVHGHGRHDALLHEVHENRTQSDFDDMCADSHNDRPASAMGPRNGLRDLAQSFHPQDIGQRAKKWLKLPHGSRGWQNRRLGLCCGVLERIGLEIRHVDRRDQARSVTGGRCRPEVGKKLFLDEFTQHVAERDVAFLNAGGDR